MLLKLDNNASVKILIAGVGTINIARTIKHTVAAIINANENYSILLIYIRYFSKKVTILTSSKMEHFLC